ncbi:MAG TPA: hypothetical protein VGD09_13730 [Blastococcus sp.]
MHQASIDGVPVFFVEGPPPLTAGLVFGVGRRDEPFVRGGITHLVEHLAMGALGRTTVDSNASVDLTTTEFTAAGRADPVVAFLRSVCLALTDLPTQRLAVEADVLRAEGGHAAPPVVGAFLGEFYGLEGAGLASVREPALRALTAADVRDWAGTRFTRQNAALWLVGPEVDGITLPLSDGTPPARGPQHRTALRTPAWTVLPSGDRVGIGAEVSVRPGMAAALEILRLRVEDELRHRRGVAYAVEADRIAVDASARFAVVTTDVRAGHETLAALVLWRELERLAQEGPLTAELDHERAVLAGYLDDPRSAAGEARALAQAQVTGIPAMSSEDVRREAESLTPEQVRACAAALRDAAVLGVPESLASPPAGLPRLPEWSADVVTGRVFARRKLSAVPKCARLVVGPDGASVVLGDDRRVTVRWVEAVGLVETGSGEFLLLGRDGFTLPISASDWRDGDEAVALARAATPVELQVTDDDADEDEGLLLVRAPAYRVREAVGLSTHAATIVYNGEWTAVLPDGAVSAVARRADLAPVLGRGSTALVLRRTHADLEYVLLRGGREVDRHRWGVAPGDPKLLADATGRREHHVAYLHGVTGDPEEIVAHVVQALGLPPEVPALLAAAPVVGEYVPGLGALGGFRASVRGEFDPPPGTRGIVPWWENLMRVRPAWFRALHAVAAALCGIAVWLLFTTDLGLHDRLLHTVTGLAIIGLAYSVWNVRPPRGKEPAAQRPHAEGSPSG